MKKEKRDKIVAQVLNEIEFARRHKQGKIQNWKKNEQMYYGRKEKLEEARANVDLGRMQEFVHTLLAKVDTPLTFNYEKRKLSQLKRVARLNSLKEFDAKRGFWNLKDLAGKKQAIIYGRAIYSYAASSDGGYKSNLENVDVYDFLIDPSAGGLDLEKAMYMGRWGVVKTRTDLEGDKTYNKDEVKRLIAGASNATTTTQEELNKQDRTYAQNVQSATKEISDSEKFKFWEWFTTYQGVRYYLLIDNSGHCLRIEKLNDMFKSGLWPFWTYAAFIDLTEFWTPSFCDYARELFMAQAVSINQMLDNAEQINKPVTYYDSEAIDNPAMLKYRRSGFVPLKGGVDVSRAVKFKETPSINTPIEVFKVLESIQDRASGVTPATAGLADTTGKATIYEGNQANAADRFGLLNKSYSFGYERFGLLYMHGVDEHLTAKIAVDVIGPDGIEVEEISRRQIFRKGDSFSIYTEASNAEYMMSEQKKRTKFALLSSLMNNPAVNQKELIQIMGAQSDLDEDTIRRLLDVDNTGSAEVLSEAARDFEDILDGAMPKPNRVANASYKQYFVNKMQDMEENMDTETYNRMVQYVRSLDEVIMANTLRQAREDAMKMASEQTTTPGKQLRMPGPAQPLQDVLQQNV